MTDNVQPPTPEQRLPDYNFETATEAERFAYDQGYEAGWDARLNPDTMELTEFLDEITEAMKAMVAKLEQRKASSRGRIEFEDAVIDLPDEENRS